MGGADPVGFAHAPVVMASEAHNGLARCIQSRDVVVRMIHAGPSGLAAAAGDEGPPWPAGQILGPIRFPESVIAPSRQPGGGVSA